MATSTPIFVKISQIAAELWRFSFFSRWRPAAILDFDTGQKWRYGTLRTVISRLTYTEANTESNSLQLVAY